MNNQLEQQLSATFPFLEEIHHEFDDGWYGIIYSLCEKIAEDLLLYPNPDFAVLQSKEKYGKLCFYTSSIPLGSKIFEYVAEAEAQSAQTCELCGSTEYVDLYGDYWLVTRCEKCAMYLHN